MKHELTANSITSNDGSDIRIHEKQTYETEFHYSDFAPDDLINLRALLEYVPSALEPVAIEYTAGQSLLQYAKFIPVPDGFTKNARLTYEDVISDDLHNLIPLQTMQLVYVSGVFTGWNITLVGEDNGSFQTLYPSIITVIS